MTKIKVEQGEEPIEIAMLADAIIAISEGIKKLRTTRLKDSTLYLLIQHATPANRRGRKPSIAEIKNVFEGIESLRQTYLKPEPKKS